MHPVCNALKFDTALTLNGLLWCLEAQTYVLPVPLPTLAWDLLGLLLEPAISITSSS